MINSDDIEHLAKLSRIELSESDTEGLTKDIESILGYVDQLKEIQTDLDVKRPSDGGLVKNVLREDGESHESGIYTDEILKEAPSVEDGFVKVKNIL
jgi:aspartyl-tRNA(Asn)/glutamyl-tRNA(Gln) amidotransferase subunit C